MLSPNLLICLDYINIFSVEIALFPFLLPLFIFSSPPSLPRSPSSPQHALLSLLGHSLGAISRQTDALYFLCARLSWGCLRYLFM